MGKSESELKPTTRSSNEPTPRAPVSVGAAVAICSGGWLIPGLGHILLGRWVRGLIFAACIVVMFSLGLLMDGRLYNMAFEQPLHIFAFLADAGVGILYMIAEHFDLGVGMMEATTYDYGTTYLWVAGLLNYLIILDAFDIARGRKP